MTSFIKSHDKTIYIEDAMQQKHSQKNQISPYLTEKDRERGFYPSCRTDRFDWQKNNSQNEIQGNRKIAGIEHQTEKSTEGRWSNLIMKTENEKVSRRSMTPQSNSCKTSQRVLNPDLLGTPKFEGIKVYKNIVNDNWQKRRQDGHEKTLETKHQKNIDSYIPNELVIPNTEGREKRDFSRLGRNEFSNRDQVSQILVDKSYLSQCDETLSQNTRSMTPSRCLYQKTHLRSGLVPTEERNEMQRINRSRSSKFQGSQLKSLLVDKSSVVSISTAESQSGVSQSEKVSAKYINRTQKRKIADEDRKFWNDIRQDDLWREEIQRRGDNRYGKDCTREYILAQNPMHRDDLSNVLTDLMSEKAIKADLAGIRNNNNKKNQETSLSISAAKREFNSRSPQPQRDNSQIFNYPTKSPQRNHFDKLSSSKSPIRNVSNQLVRSETYSNLSSKTGTNTHKKDTFDSTSSHKPYPQLSKSPVSNRINTYQANEHQKSPMHERNLQSKSPSRYSSNNTIKAPSIVYSSYSAINNNRHNSKSPSQVGNRAPLSQISNSNNMKDKQAFSSKNTNRVAPQSDDQSIRSVVQNLFQEKFNYQKNKGKTENDSQSDNYSILSYSISQVGANSKVPNNNNNNQSTFNKQNCKYQLMYNDRKENLGVNFGDSQSTISHISNAKSKVSALTANNKENPQLKQTTRRRGDSSRSPLSNRSQISQILHQL